MKTRLLAQILTALGLAIGAVLKISQPSYAEPTGFFCVIYNNALATIAHTPRGDIPIVFWRSEYFSRAGYTPDRRCLEVSRKFQRYYKKGTMNYLTTGIMNGLPVVCVAETIGGHCTGLLFTLRPGSNPNDLLLRILPESIDKTEYGFWESEDEILYYIHGRAYIDMNEYLDRVPVEEEDSYSTLREL